PARIQMSGSRATAHTFAPSAASASTFPRPNPRLQPSTSADLFADSLIVCLSFHIFQPYNESAIEKDTVEVVPTTGVDFSWSARTHEYPAAHRYTEYKPISSIFSGQSITEGW